MFLPTAKVRVPISRGDPLPCFVGQRQSALDSPSSAGLLHCPIPLCKGPKQGSLTAPGNQHCLETFSKASQGKTEASYDPTHPTCSPCRALRLSGYCANAAIMRCRTRPSLQAKDQIMTLLQEQSTDVQQIDRLLDILIDSKDPFRERQLGGGPWQVCLHV